MSARGIIIGAPRSGSGKTSVTIGLLRALRPARHRGARREIRAGLHRSRLPRRGDRPARRQPRQLGDAARRCSTALAGEAAERRRPGGHRKRHGPVRRHPGRRRPLGRGGRPRAALSACRCCWCSTSPASRRRRRPSPRASPPTIPAVRDRRRGAQPRRQRAAPAAGRRGDRGARPAGGRRDHARSRRWRCPSAISAWCRRASMPRSRRSSSGWPT